MSETFGAELSPAENSYFESGGTTEIPTGEQAAGQAEDVSGETEGKADGDKDAGQTEPKVEKMVSLAALHEERTRRRQIDQEFRKTQQELAELKGKLSIIDRLNVQEQKGPPTPEEDIFGAVKNTTETVAQMQKRLDAQEAAAKAEGERHALISNYRADAAQFEAKTPDFKAAYAHLLKSRADELSMLGYDDPKAINDALVADEMAIAQTALARGQSPAEVLYKLAEQRGYKKAAAPSEANDAARKLETIQRGQATNKTLTATGGSSGEADMTAERLLKMPMDEYEAWVNKNPAKAKRLMGG